MDTALKQRLVGAAVLVALAVIFLPMLVKGPAPDSGVSDVSIDMPPAPESGMETRELPLVQPGNVPAGGAVGLDARPVDAAAPPPAAPEAAAAADLAAAPADPAAVPAAAPPATGALPPATAGGGYAVHFGAYASSKAAETVATLARDAGLPAYTEATQLGSRQAWRVRIGPYVNRAEAEIVRVKALEVRSDVPVRVVALDAAVPTATAPTAAASGTAPTGAASTTPAPAAPTATTAPASARPEPAKPEVKPEARPVARPPAPKPAAPAPTKPATPVSAAKQPSSATAKVGFAVQLGAFGDPAEAEALRQRLRGAGFSAFTEQVDTDKGRLTRVSVGPALDRADADRLKAQIQAKTGLDGFVRSHP